MCCQAARLTILGNSTVSTLPFFEEVILLKASISRLLPTKPMESTKSLHWEYPPLLPDAFFSCSLHPPSSASVSLHPDRLLSERGLTERKDHVRNN